MARRAICLEERLAFARAGEVDACERVSRRRQVIGKEIAIMGSYAWVNDEFSAAVDMIEAGAIDTTGWFTRSTFAEGQQAFEELVDSTDRFKTVLLPKA